MQTLLNKSSILSLMFAFGLSTILFVGCGDSASNTDGDSDSATTEESDDKMSSADSDADEIEASLAKLSAEDRALAEAQEICPVGGGKLGFMGKPYKVDIDGEPIFLCCDGCESDMKEDPEKYLAVLAEHKSKSQDESDKR